MPSSGELIQDLELLTCSENDLGAPVQEGTEIGATSGANELEQDPLDCAQPDFHINSSYATGDARPQIEGDLQGESEPSDISTP
ncbi:uncharacterized protein LOC129298282 isoform X2 [Prosopis cineraria]|uniref:uncharacterized protein LOC129298282 isoform X2 n=1 Tax=Prosopis cineraria TaxID=364024 RepID=UPI00240FFEB0|nr:uncharacterized protein LOC129298282 isoform X2 [Prosopis cineraria]